MKEIVTRIYCDRKNIHPDTQEPGYEVSLLNSKSKPVAVDMCEPCEKGITLSEARELADAIGQPIELPTRTRRPKPAPGPCPEADCDAEFPTAQGLSMHLTRTHGYQKRGR